LEESVATLNIKNLPDALYRKLQRRAKQRHRSTAQEVTRLLEKALAEPESLSILALRGLGREAWVGIDPAAHVEAERHGWD
jgi:plasmid stability protein